MTRDICAIPFNDIVEKLLPVIDNACPCGEILDVTAPYVAVNEHKYIHIFFVETNNDEGPLFDRIPAFTEELEDNVLAYANSRFNDLYDTPDGLIVSLLQAHWADENRDHIVARLALGWAHQEGVLNEKIKSDYLCTDTQVGLPIVKGATMLLAHNNTPCAVSEILDADTVRVSVQGTQTVVSVDELIRPKLNNI